MKIAIITGDKTAGKTEVANKFADYPNCALLHTDCEITKPLRKELCDCRTMEETLRWWDSKSGRDDIEARMCQLHAKTLATFDKECVIAEGWIYHSTHFRRALYCALEQNFDACLECRLFEIRPTIDVAIERLIKAEKERHETNKFANLSREKQVSEIYKRSEAWIQIMEPPDDDERQFLSGFQIFTKTEELENCIRDWFGEIE